jgi:hypothetical protein
MENEIFKGTAANDKTGTSAAAILSMVILQYYNK